MLVPDRLIGSAGRKRGYRAMTSRRRSAQTATRHPPFVIPRHWVSHGGHERGSAIAGGNPSASVDGAMTQQIATPATRRRAVVKRGIVVGVAGVAMVVAGLTGCSSNKSSTNPSPSGSAATAAGPQVIIDGQSQPVTGQVSCTAKGANTNIGIGDASNGVGAVVS